MLRMMTFERLDEVVGLYDTEAQSTLMDTAGAVKRPRTCSDDEPHGTTSWSRGGTSGRGKSGYEY